MADPPLRVGQRGALLPCTMYLKFHGSTWQLQKLDESQSWRISQVGTAKIPTNKGWHQSLIYYLKKLKYTTFVI